MILVWQPDLFNSKNKEKVQSNNKTVPVPTTEAPSTKSTQRIFKSKTSFSENKEGQSISKPYFKLRLDNTQKSTHQDNKAMKNFLSAIMITIQSGYPCMNLKI